MVCVTEGNYGGQLTRGRVYEIVEIDDGASQYRVKNDQNRLKWYPASSFAEVSTATPRLASFVLDDSIQDPAADWIEVSFTLTDGSTRWCAFTTPAHLARHGETFHTSGVEFRATYDIAHVVIVSELSAEVIEAMLRHMDGDGLLVECSREL